jgi:ceramide glucosyltransferase
MLLLGKKIATMHEPLSQPLQNYSIKAFWSRHLRWGRIRKSQETSLFLIEPLFTSWASGLMGAWAFAQLGWMTMSMAFLVHMVLWLLSDLVMMSCMGESAGPKALSSWVLREILNLPLWVHISMGRTVVWREKKLVLQTGGLLES